MPALYVNVRAIGVLSVFQLLKQVLVYTLENKEKAAPSILSLLLFVFLCVVFQKLVEHIDFFFFFQVLSFFRHMT